MKAVSGIGSMHQKFYFMNADCSRFHSRVSGINGGNIPSTSCVYSLQAKRSLDGQHWCSAIEAICQYPARCCRVNGDKISTLADRNALVGMGSTLSPRRVKKVYAARNQGQGSWTPKPAGGSVRRGERMEANDQHECSDADQSCYPPGQNEADATTKLITSLPGFINPTNTVGRSTNIVWQECMVKKEERQKLLGQKGCVIWMTGLSGSGKSTLACTLDHQLSQRGNLSYVLDGDNLRHGLNNDLGFSLEDRSENIRRIGEVARILVDTGVICIVSAISPYRKDREACRHRFQPGEFIEVYMHFPLELCETRDPKGLYKLARAGKIKGFTGVDDPYEAPLSSEVVMEPLAGNCPTPAEMAQQLLSYLEKQKFLGGF